MYRDALQKLEGVWIGTERVEAADGRFEATGRWAFNTVFDGLFLLCDYVQTARDRPVSVGHGVFRLDEKTQALTVTWFRSPSTAAYEQAEGVAEGDKLVFQEKQGNVTTRTRYAIHLNLLTITTEHSTRDGEWRQVFEGTYRRPRG